MAARQAKRIQRPHRGIDRLGFRVAGEWSVDDLALFARSVEDIYNGLLAARVARSLRDEYARGVTERFRRLRKRGYTGRLLVEWERMIEYDPYLASDIPLAGLVPGRAALALPTIDGVFREIEIYATSAERLRVCRIQISSPGGFNLQGVGEIVEQFRQLVKDLWYRNEQERVKGELEIVSEYLRIRRENPDVHLSAPPQLAKARYTIKQVHRAVENLQRLERDQKLLSPPENLDYDPGEQPA